MNCLNRKHFETSIWLNSDSAFHEVVIAPALIFKCDRIPIAVSGTSWWGSELLGGSRSELPLAAPGKSRQKQNELRHDTHRRYLCDRIVRPRRRLDRQPRQLSSDDRPDPAGTAQLER